MARRPDDLMVQVELDDDDERGPATPVTRRPTAEDATEPTPAGRRPMSRRRRRWLVLGAAGVIVLAAVAVAVDLTRGSDIGPLDQPLAGRWTLPGGTVLGTADGVVLARSGATVTGYAENDGAELWRIELGAASGVDACASAVTTDPGRLWCWRTAQPAVTTTAGQTAQRQAALVGVDVHDGTLATVREMAVPWAGVVAVGPDLVLGDRVRGELTLQRVDPSGWSQEWVSRVALAPEGSSGRIDASIEGIDDVVVVHGPTVAVVDAADGRVLGTWGSAFDDAVGLNTVGADVAVTPYGFAATAPQEVGSDPVGSTWYDADGREVVTFQGVLAEPAASDGSVPGVVLVSRRGGAEIAGVDAATGADVWTLPTEGGVVIARAEGTAVIATGQTLTGVELLTGWQRWSADVAGLRTDAGSVSDGDVAVVMAVQTRAWVFVAYDVTTGERLWFARAAGTPDLDDLFYIGGAPRLTMVGERAVVQSGQGATWLG